MAKKTKKPRKRNPEKTKQNKELRAWRKRALERAAGKCEWCGSSGPRLNCHHIIDRRYKPLLTDDANSIILCAKCHKFDIGLAAHANPIRVSEWLKASRPLAWNKLFEITEQEVTKDYVKSKEKTSYNGKRGRKRVLR